MKNASQMVDLVLKTIALAMAVASVVLGLLGTLSTRNAMILLGVGLFALALERLQEG